MGEAKLTSLKEALENFAIENTKSFNRLNKLEVSIHETIR